MSHYDEYSQDCACGGVTHRGVDFGTHMIRSVQEHFKSRNVSLSVLFLDLSLAFDMLDRNMTLVGDKTHY